MSSFSRFAPLLALTGLSLAACQPPAAGGTVAVIDLSLVAEATGQDEAIRSQAEMGLQELTSQLQNLASEMDQQISAEREKLGDNPGEADAARLQQMAQEARQQINAAQQQAQQQANQMEASLVFEFREKVMPLAREVAQQKGISLILSNDAYVFWADDSVNITAAVIAAWPSTGAAGDGATAAPATLDGDVAQ